MDRVGKYENLFGDERTFKLIFIWFLTTFHDFSFVSHWSECSQQTCNAEWDLQLHYPAISVFWEE